MTTKRHLGAVIPLQPLDNRSIQRPMRTVFYQEFGNGQHFEIQASGENPLERMRDLKRLQEYLTMVHRWAVEDEREDAERQREWAEAWWEAEMQVLRERTRGEEG